MTKEQEIYPRITNLSGNVEIVTQAFCNLLQYRSPRRPAFIEVSVIAQTGCQGGKGTCFEVE